MSNVKYKRTDVLSVCHCGTNNRAPRWTFTDPCKPDLRPGTREESASPAWLAAPAMIARDTTKTLYGRFNIYTTKGTSSLVLRRSEEERIKLCNK